MASTSEPEPERETRGGHFMNRRNTAFRCQALVMVAAVLAGSTMAGAVTRKFYPDDPLTRDPEDRDASHVMRQAIDHAYGGFQTLRGVGDHAWRHARDVNSMDEVPDSSWFTNRIGVRPMSIAEIARGPDHSPGPAPGRLTVVAGKSDGVTPGFQVRDSGGQRYFVKFDPPANPELSSAAEIIATKIFHALGYYVPENHIATARREDFTIGDGATIKGPDGKKRPFTPQDLDQVLQRAARQDDGSYRFLASLALEGAPVGPFRYNGTRPDDPNDNVPHEHRRELRGLRVFAAWLNDVDAKPGNSLDTLVHEGGHTIVRHNLLDFGSTLGSGGTEPMGWRDGYEYAFDKRAAMLALASLGLYVPPWQRIRYPQLPSVGRIEADHFRPERWKPTLPNPAFQNARPDDTFWAARLVMAFTDEAIRSVVETARLSDPQAAAYLTRVLIRRRDAIGRTWLTDVNPVVQPSVTDAGVMSFRNAATDAGVATEPAEYEVNWAIYDNTTGVTTSIGHAERCARRECALPTDVTAGTQYLRAEIRTIHPAYPAWRTPVRVFFRRDHDNSWTAVGLERLPEDAPREGQFANRRDRPTPSNNAGE
jgi:hypothetical protein